MSIGSRGAALSTLGSGLLDFGSQIMDVSEARRKERAEAPTKELQQQFLSSQVAVARVAEEQAKREEEARLKIMKLEEELKNDPAFRDLFQKQIKAGVDIVEKQKAAQAPPVTPPTMASGSDIPQTAPKQIPKLMGSNPADLGVLGSPAKPGMTTPSFLDIPAQQPALSYEEKWLKAARGSGVDITGGDIGARRKQYEDAVLKREREYYRNRISLESLGKFSYRKK